MKLYILKVKQSFYSMHKLSIGIPTYNRRNQLNNQINRLLKQDLSEIEEILIIDNNSDYDAHDFINSFNSNKLRLVKNPINVGMSTNVQIPFLECKTEWLWTLADDDEVLDNSIKTIISRINETASNTGMIKFSLKKDNLPVAKIANNLNEYIDYYYNEKNIRHGELVFLSTNVFNVKILSDYLNFAFEFSYTHVGFLVPVIIGLNEKKITVDFASEPIVKYLAPEDNGWSFATVGLGLSTISHLNLSLKKTYYKKFLKIMMPISYIEMFKYLIQKNNPNNKRIYELIYCNSYKYYLNFFQKIKYSVFKGILSYPKIGKYLFEKIKLYYKRIK
jgi:glycosyltransferase involved in cell wall biosynthesis